jgi:RNA polymerase sigma-70 factor, ECF subfamily
MKPSILYIEDEPDYQTVVRRILGRAGHTLETAETAQEGLEVLRRGRPGLLLLDVNLPDTDGYTFCHSLRQNPAWLDLPILLLTIRRRPDEWLRGFSSGANDYVAKPINPSELLERVENILAGKTYRRTGHESAEYALVQAAVSGNRPAYDILIQEYQERLRDTLRRTVHSNALLEDIMAQTFAQAYEKLVFFRGQSSFYTWLYRIAINELLRLQRKPEIISLDELTRGEDCGLVALVSAEHGEESVIRSETQRRVRQALKQVPERYKRVLDLFVYDDLPYEAISKKLRIPLGTVMSRLYKARKLLKATWRRRHPVGP